MSSLKELLTPARQNPIQRLGFFGSIAIAVLVLFLHFPIDGYKIGYYETPYYDNFSGPETTTTYIQCPDSYTLDTHKIYSRCMSSTENKFEMLPFSEWKSKAPIVEWFGSVIHAITALVFALSLGGIWLWVFRTHDDEQ